LACALITLAGLARPALAQRALGATDDATVVPRGMLRLAIVPTWARANERFGDGLRGRALGTPERLGVDYHLDSLGPAHLETLAPVVPALQVLAGKTALPVSLGRLRVDFDASTVTTPITLEFGLTRRFTLGVLVPYVKTRNEVSLNPNPGRDEGTMGINPARMLPGARLQNKAAYDQINDAVQQLNARLTACQGSTAPECSAVNADRARATQLATAGAAVSGALAQVFGTTEGQGSPLAPVGGSTLYTDISSRLATLSTDFAAFLGAPSSRTDWVLARPVGAPLMGLTDFNSILNAEMFGIGAAPLETVERSHIGDIEVGGKFLLYDGLGVGPPQRVDYNGIRFRLAVGGAYRPGTAQLESADDFADIGSGDGSTDIEGRVFADVLFGRRMWASFVGRYGVQQADEQYLRVRDTPSDPFPALYRRQFVGRDLGDYFVGEVSPRVGLSESLVLGATYSYARKGKDAYTGDFPATNLSGEAITLDASTLDAGTERVEQRLIGSITFSTMAAWYRGRSRLPLEVSYSFGQSLAGSGGAMKAFSQALGLRVYARIFGAGRSRE